MIYPFLKNGPQSVKGWSSIPCHNRRFLRCHTRLVRMLVDCRLVLVAAAGGTSGTCGAAGASFPPLLLSLSDNSMKTPAIKIANSNIIFLLMVRF